MHLTRAFSLLGALTVIPLLLCISHAAIAQPIKINTGFTPPVSYLLLDIMQATFNRAGLDMIFSEQPAERSIALVARGIDDAECCRIPKAISSDYPGLVQVPEVVYTARFSAFAKPPLPQIDGFEALKSYSVATVSGWKILVNNLQRIKPETLHIVDNAKSMFQVLDLDRIDVATYGYLSGKQTLAELGLKSIQVIEPPLASAPLYLFLHRKHAHLVPQLTQAIRSLKADGSLERILRSYDR